MANSTLILIGPGGIGKTPLDAVVRPEVLRLDPYRLRPAGPRDRADRLYAPPRLRDELTGVLRELGDAPTVKEAAGETVEWYPRARVAFFTVRGEWQLAVIPPDTGTLAKMEIYAPVLPALVTIPAFAAALGEVHIVLLSPAPEPLASMADWTEIARLTRRNCLERGDTDESAEKRAGSVSTEAPYWRELVAEHGAVEAVGWPFPEYVYRTDPDAARRAREHLLALDPTLAPFF